MEHFTPVSSFLGGMLLGLASAALLFFVGRIAGISGIFGGLLHATRGETLWRACFIGGLFAGGLLVLFLHPTTLTFQVERSVPALIVAGLLVGIGARLGNGCTSGHGICGLGRLAPRSVVAVAVFMAAAVASATIVNHVFGGHI